MNPIAALVSILVVIGVTGCSTQNARRPSDAADIDYWSVSISVSSERNEEMVMSGIISGIIFGPGLLVGSPLEWPDGSPANVAIDVSTEELQSIASNMVREFSSLSKVNTYSERTGGAKRDPSLGIYASDYFSERERNPRVSIRLSGVKGDYSRSMWLVAPMNQVDHTFWDSLITVLPEEERFRSFVDGLRVFWLNNT